MKSMRLELELVKQAQNSPVTSEHDKAVIDNLVKRLNFCESSLNHREQYQRLWCVRIFGLNVPDSMVRDHGVVNAVIKHSYETLVYPILSKASESKLDVIPPLYQLIENGHFIKNRNGLPCIILRFHSRYIRNLLLSLKKEHMPQPTFRDKTKGTKYYTITPDLTATNYRILKELRNDDRVNAAWAFETNLCFTLHQDPETVHRVSSIHCPIDETINLALESLIFQDTNQTSSLAPPNTAPTPVQTRSQRNKEKRPMNERKSHVESARGGAAAGGDGRRRRGSSGHGGQGRSSQGRGQGGMGYRDGGRGASSRGGPGNSSNSSGRGGSSRGGRDHGSTSSGSSGSPREVRVRGHSSSRSPRHDRLQLPTNDDLNKSRFLPLDNHYLI